MAPGAVEKNKDSRGLAGQTVGETEICSVNQTQLIYRGYEIADLAENACFEEVAYLLLVGHKPTRGELLDFKQDLIKRRPISSFVKQFLIDTAEKFPNTHPMSVLRSAVSISSQGLVDPENTDWEKELDRAKNLLAQIPTMIGVYQMALDGKSPVDPDSTMGHAGNLLWCMTGRRPGIVAERVMDVSLILYAEHDFNASTFASRVIASTNSDMYSSVCGGIGALKGNLHGGANEAAMEMLFEIMKSVESGQDTTESWLQRAFVEKRKLMGFGHRVYKNGDHRAGILRSWGLKYVDSENEDAKKWFKLGDSVQNIMLEQKNIHPNVDFPCGMTYFAMGIPVPQYTPVFVASRVVGWCAHIIEQRMNNRIIRPLASYVGPDLKGWNDGT